MLIDGISRATLRQMAIKALIEAQTMAGAKVFGWADWPTDPKLFPMILVSTPRERKVSLYPGLFQFDSTISLVTVSRVVAAMPAAAGQAMELLQEQITDAFCLNQPMDHAIQQVNIVEATTALSSEARQHVGELVMTFEMVVYQEYGPIGAPIEGFTPNFSVVNE
jgi:hypothetical protein